MAQRQPVDIEQDINNINQALLSVSFPFYSIRFGCSFRLGVNVL
jgi:hypothetical protein